MSLFSLKSQTTGVVKAFSLLDVLRLIAGERAINDEIVIGNQVYHLSSYQAIEYEKQGLQYRCLLEGSIYSLPAAVHQLPSISSIQFTQINGLAEPLLNYEIDEQLNIRFEQNSRMDGIIATLHS